MSSVYRKILLWSLVTLLISMAALTGINILVSLHDREREGPGGLNALFFDEAMNAYKTGGPSRLADELERIDAHMHDHH